MNNDFFRLEIENGIATIWIDSKNDKMNIVGFDFVEVNPKLDVGTNVTSYLGALTVAMFLGFIDEKRRLKLS